MTKNIFAESRLIFLGGGEISNHLMEAENPEPEPIDLTKKLEQGLEYSLQSKDTKLSLVTKNPNLQKYFKKQQEKYAPPSDSQRDVLGKVGEKFNPNEILNTDISIKLALWEHELKFTGSANPDEIQAKQANLNLRIGEEIQLDTKFDFQKEELSAKLGLSENLSVLGDSGRNVGVEFSTKNPAGNFTGRVDRSDGKVKISGIFEREDLTGKISFSETEIAAGFKKGEWTVETNYNLENGESKVTGKLHSHGMVSDFFSFVKTN